MFLIFLFIENKSGSKIMKPVILIFSLILIILLTKGQHYAHLTYIYKSIFICIIYYKLYIFSSRYLLYIIHY